MFLSKSVTFNTHMNASLAKSINAVKHIILEFFKQLEINLVFGTKM